MKSIITLFLVIAINSCSNDSGDNNHYVLKYNTCLDIRDTSYSLCLDSISDSRCPTHMVCVWEGNASAYLSLNSESEQIPFTLNTHKNFQQDTLINGIKISLIKISPYPLNNTPKNQDVYSVELEISNE